MPGRAEGYRRWAWRQRAPPGKRRRSRRVELCFTRFCSPDNGAMIPTEPIDSVLRAAYPIASVSRLGHEARKSGARCAEAVRDTIGRFDATGSPAVADGEQRTYHDFWTRRLGVGR